MLPFPTQRPSFLHIIWELNLLEKPSFQISEQIELVNKDNVIEEIISKAFTSKVFISWTEFSELLATQLSPYQLQTLQHWFPNYKDKLYRSQWFTFVNIFSTLLSGFSLLRIISELLCPGWFVGKMVSQEIQNLLVSQNKDCFVFHFAPDRGSDHIVLSVRVDGKIFHHDISFVYSKRGGFSSNFESYLTMEGQKFSNFHELVAKTVSVSKVSPLHIRQFPDMSLFRAAISYFTTSFV